MALSIAIVAAFSFLIAGGALYAIVLAQAKANFPPQFQEEVAARWALDTFIWEKRFPAALHHKYLLASVFAALAFACLSFVVFVHGERIGAAIFLGLSAFALGHTTLRWMKYRDRL